ncbi:MAG: GNAT family N-acetyltransferase [Gammaproteobacteria bacterium]|nr:GNAT family N-acetyltransferase [Gammaproteobacteria bacterium]
MLTAVYASDADYDFIRKEIILGARKKHFAFSVKDPEDMRFVEENIRSAIHHHCFTSGLRVQPILFMKKQRRVGVVMMSEVSPGKGGNEIHMVFVGHKHRGKGYGSQMIDLILAERQDVAVFARCTVASQCMYEMLERRGFEYQYTMKDGFRVLLRPRQVSLVG